ncbi:hypothetical protein [Pelagibius sp.]|uniref:hypothetical protein n=1 Tax=Pelagibius sp. TaxID=1931238 RepID=UPI0026307215|nr:hypothetical protein [Pelagibius sp.]
MPTATSIRRAGFAAALGLGLTGCAVMQIDVDVYKGPLANHKDVHTEQVAVMAVGAQPLVERLHDDLTVACAKALPKAIAQDEKLRATLELARQKVSSTGNLPDEFDRQTPAVCFQQEVVAGILNLFKDREELGAEGRLLSLTERVETAARRLQRADAILNAESLSKPLERLRGILQDQSLGDSWKPRLAKAYVDFLAAPGDKRRPWNPIFDALRLASDDEKEKAIGPFARRPERLPHKEDPLLSSSNYAYQVLSDDGFLQAQAAVLFPQNKKHQALFVREVRRVAASFATAREAVSDILLNTLEGLTLVDRVKFTSESVKEELTADVAEFVVRDLVQIDHLRVVLIGSRPRIAQKSLAEELKDKQGIDVDAIVVQNDGIADEDTNKLIEALVPLLQQDPVTISQILLALDSEFKRGTVLDLTEGHDERYQQSERRRYGLASGPSEAIFRKISEDAKRIGPAVRRSVLFFSEGRFSDGIFTLIDSYLSLQNQDILDPCGVEPLCEGGPTELETRRELLLTALVHFAEKVLFVVNNEVLFDDDSNLKDKDYIKVLQTVGNSMLVHVDAIRQETAHERRLADATEREAEGIAQVFGGSATLAFAQVLQSLREAIAAAEDEAKRQKVAAKQATDDLTKATQAFAAAQTAAGAATGSTGPQPQRPPDMAMLQAAWVSIGRDPKALDTNAAAAEPADLAVKVRIDGLVADSATSVADFYGKVVELLASEFGAEASKTVPSASRFGRLNLAIEQFIDQAFSAKFDPPEATKEAQRAKIENAIKTDYLSKNVAFLKQHAAYFTALGTQNLAEASKFAAETEMKRATAAQIEATDKAQAALATARRLGAAEPFLIAAQAPVITAAEGSAARPIGRAVHVELSSHLRAEAGKPGNATRKQELEAAATVAESLPIPLVAPSGYSVGAKNAKEVLDGLIASLRQLYTRTQLENVDEQNNMAIARAAAALAEAYRQRADMVYIRPAMAYLRTSFTATTLQDNRLAWRNMLRHHGYRSTVPLIPEIQAKWDAEVVEEIDKQFWHSVNRVRVAGSGDTNYAIAKDDLGNWYVKSYSTDPRDIIRSAKNLALFSAGPALGVPIPLDLESDQPQTTDPDAPAPAAGLANQESDDGEGQPDPSKSVFVRQFERFRAKFRQESKNDIAIAKEMAGSFKQRIEKGWKDRGLDQMPTINNIDDILDPGEKEPIKTKLLDLVMSEVELKDAPRQLSQALRAVRDYHLRVTQALRDKGGLSEEDRKRAIRTVTDVVLRAELKQMIERFRRNMDRYAVELEIIGQTGTDLDLSELGGEDSD